MRAALTIAKVLAALVLLLLVVVGSLLLLVHTERGRALACDRAFDAINGAIPGTIFVERCASLSPWLVRLEGVEIHDPGQRTIARADAIEATPDWAALLSGTIGLDTVRASAPRLRLVGYETELAIVAAFVSPDDEPDDPNDEGVDVVIGAIEIDEGAVTDLPSGLSVERLHAQTNLVVRDAVRLDVAHLQAEVEQDGKALVNATQAHGTAHFGDEMHIALEMDFEAEGERGNLDATFKGTLERFSVDATLEALGGRLRLDGRNDHGALEARLDARDLDLGRTPWVGRGVARGEVRAVLRFSDPALTLDTLEHVQVEGDLALASLERGQMRAKDLAVEIAVEGRLRSPTARVTIRANQVTLDDTSIDRLELVVAGEDGRYTARGRAPLPNGWIARLGLGASIEWPIVRVDGSASLERSPWSPVVATFAEVGFEPGKRLSVDSLSVRGKGIGLDATGQYLFDDEIDVAFRVRSLDLARITQAFDLGLQLAGNLQGAGRIDGPNERPALTATFDVEDGKIEALPVESLGGTLAYSARESARANLDVDLGDRGVVTLRADATLSRAPSLSEALRTARFDVRLVVESLDVHAMSDLVDELPPLEGRLTSEVTVHGTLASLDVELNAAGRGISGAGLKPMDLHLATSLRRGNWAAELDAETDAGGALNANAQARLDLPKLFRGAPWTTIADEPWSVSIRIPEQRWAALPFDAEFPTPARVRLDVQASGGKTPVVADLDLDLKMPPPRAAPADPSAPPAPCPSAEPARLRARVELREADTRVSVEGYVAHDQVLRGNGHMKTPLLSWVRHGMPSQWPAASVKVEIDPIELGAVPVLCEQAAGELQARLDATGLFRLNQDISIRLEGRKLRFENEIPIDVLAQAVATATSASAEARAFDGDRELFEMFAHVPLDLRTPDVPIAIGDGEISASANFDDAPLSVLLAPLPWVARPSGRLNGNLTASGRSTDLSTVQVRGAIRLAEASMTLKDPFVRLDDVDADLQIEPNELVVRSLSAHDRDGRVQVEGRIGLDAWEPGEVELTLRADQFPLRRAGVLLATFNGRAEITGDLSSDPRALRMVLGQEVSLVLPENLEFGGVQELAQHPLVIYPGQPGFDRTLGVQKALAAHRSGAPDVQQAPPLLLRVRSTEPSWVRRPDFSLQLSLDVEVHSENDATWLTGTVDVRRGFLALLNKNFDIQSGSLEFTGATPINPTVDLSAKHRLNDGYSVTVDIKGSVSDPELTFSTDAPGANTNAEIIALLLGTSRQGTADAQADNQTRSVLAGLTAGLVGSVARRELGQYAPIIAVESEGTLDSTGVRAGFTIGDLVPEAWQSVLLGVYVEGLLAGSEQGPRGGLLLELLFPHHLSTTTTYEQPDNWSLDFLWQP